MITYAFVSCVFVDIQVFSPLFDKIIDERHNGYKPQDIHRTDLDYTKVGLMFSHPYTA